MKLKGHSMIRRKVNWLVKNMIFTRVKKVSVVSEPSPEFVTRCRTAVHKVVDREKRDILR